jgi:hypothetical protein
MAEGGVIGRLIGNDHEIVILASSLGPRYSVYDASGNLLAAKLTIEQLGRRFPDLETMVSTMMQPSKTVRMGVVDETHQRSVIDDH